MKSSKLAIRWEPEVEFAEMEIDKLEKKALDRTGDHTRRVAQTDNSLRCPHCSSIVYSRRHRLCGACSGELPDSCLFSEQEARRVEMLLRSEQERHRRWTQKVFHKVLQASLIFE